MRRESRDSAASLTRIETGLSSLSPEIEKSI